MAIFEKDPFPGTDYTKYLDWEKVTLPSGETYYVVPGHPGYVLDPVASNATGRKVFRPNPSQNIKDQQDQKRQQEELIKQQQFNQSPAGQLLPVVAGTGGLIAAQQFAPSSAADLAAAELIKQQGIKTVAGAAASGASGASVATPQIVGATRVPAAAEGIGYMPYVGAAGALLGGKGIYDAIQANDVKGGAISGAGVGLGLGAAAPLLGFAGPAGWAGYAGLAALGALGGGGLTKLFGHETTRDVAKKHTSQLLNQGKDDPTYQNYVQGMREQYNSAAPDPSKPFHGGQYGSWDEYKKAGLDAADLTGVYGNIKTFGQEWASLSQEQRQAVTKGIIDAGLYESKKGEVEITDPSKAKEIKDNVLKGFSIGAQAEAAARGGR